MSPSLRPEDFKIEIVGCADDRDLVAPGSETHTMEIEWNPVSLPPFPFKMVDDYQIVHKAPLWMRFLLPWRRWTVVEFTGKVTDYWEDAGTDETQVRFRMGSAPKIRYTFRKP